MKKIISLLSVFAMICTMLTTVAFAGSDEIYWEESVDGTNVTLTLVVESSTPVTTAKLYFDGTAAADACDSIEVAKLDASTATYNASKKVIAFTYANPDGSDKIELATVTFNNVKSTFTLPKHTTKWVVTDATKVDFLPGMTISADGYEVKAIGGDDKPVAMEEAVAGNDMYGMKTALTKISFKEVANPVVKLAKDGVDSGKTYELPANVKGGTTDIIGIIRYAASEKGTFVLSVFDGETSIASTTYVAE